MGLTDRLVESRGVYGGLIGNLQYLVEVYSSATTGGAGLIAASLIQYVACLATSAGVSRSEWSSLCASAFDQANAARLAICS